MPFDSGQGPLCQQLSRPPDFDRRAAIVIGFSVGSASPLTVIILCLDADGGAFATASVAVAGNTGVALDLLTTRPASRGRNRPTHDLLSSACAEANLPERLHRLRSHRACGNILPRRLINGI